MKVAIVAGIIIEEIKELSEVLESKGHSVDYISFPTLTIEDLDNLGEKFSDYDLIYYRIGLGNVGRLAMGEVIDFSKTAFINHAFYKHPFCTNKIFQTYTAKQNGILVPKTFISKSKHNYENVVEQIGSPFIAKAAYGIQGKKVFLVNNKEEYGQVCSVLQGDKLFQEYIPNDGDYRVFIIGDKVSNIFKRIPPEGSFKANISQGGHGEEVTDEKLRDELSKISLKISTALDLDLTGIDIIKSKEDGKLYFLESNINPGWKGLDNALGTNTSLEIAEYFEKLVAKLD